MRLKYAAFFIVDSNDKTFLIRYAQGSNRGLYSGAGGHIDPDDISPKSAAIRELKEETGIDYHKLDIMHERAWVYNKITQLIVLRVVKIPQIKLSFEHDDYKRIHIREILKYPLTEAYKKSLIRNLNYLK